MVSTRQKRQTIGARSMYNRIMRLVVPIIMGTFLIIGLVLLFGIRASSQDTLTQSHHAEIADFVRGVNGEIQRRVDSVSGLAGGRDTRDFARDTLVNTAGTTVNDSQTRLLGDFTNLLDENPTYLAIRYVTFNGSVWSEVSNYDGTVPRADASVKLGKFANDPSLTQALAVTPGQVVVSDIIYQLNPNVPILDRLVPFIRLSTPVVPDSTFDMNVGGVVQLDALATPILDYVRSAANTEAKRQDGRRVIIANSAGQILYDTAHPDLDYVRALALNQAPTLNAQYPNDTALFTADAATVDAQVSGEAIFSTGRVNFSEQSSGFWSVTLVDNASLLQNGPNALALSALIGSLLLGAVISLFISLILQRTLRPIGSANLLVTQLTHQSDGGQPDGSETDGAKGNAILVAAPAISMIGDDDEIGQLIESFQTMSSRVDTLKAELDIQQGRYTRNMDIAARVSRETATLYDIDALLNRAINLICDEFGYYHAQVFLIDDVGENAVLVYSHGDVGQQLLQAGHKIRVGSESVIGTITKTGEVVVVNDTTSGGVAHQFNALLPQTRAEIALPLLSGQRILGALDVQSVQSNSFQPDEVRTFEILADQIAVAIQNARLLVQSEERITQIDTLNRQLTRSAWEETSERSNLEPIYRYDLLNLTHDEPYEQPGMSLPISIRGEVVGTINAASPENMTFTDGDRAIMRAVADRVAIAIENARLFEETEQALDETQRLYAASRSVTTAADVSAVYQSVVSHLATAGANIHRVSILLAQPSPSAEAPYVEYTHIWTRISSELQEGDQIPRDVVSFPALLREGSGMALIDDVKTIENEALKKMLRQSGSAILVAIQSRLRWYGVLVCESPQPSAFNESYVNFMRAIADQVAIAVESLLSFEEAQTQTQRALALAEAGQLASQMSIGFNQNLDEVFTRVAKPGNYDRWLLVLADSETQRLNTVIEHMPTELTGIQETSMPFNLASNSTPITQSYLTGRTILLNDPKRFPGYVSLTPEQQTAMGKSVITPVRVAGEAVGVLLVGRSPRAADMDDSDRQLVSTLAAQVGIAVENQRLLHAAESERERLSSILASLPAGVLVLDPVTYKPLQYNAQVEQMLGQHVDSDQPFDPAAYRIYRSGTDALYPIESLPIYAVASTKELVASDDIAIVREDGSEVDLLMNAVPILDDDGNIRAIVAAFQDISALRNLERTLETNLRETVALYETTRALAEAEEVEEVLDQVLVQLATQDVTEAYVLLLDEQLGGVRIARSLGGSTGEWTLPSEVLNPRNALLISDVQVASEFEEATRVALLQANIAALSSIPLRARSRRDVPLGWLIVTYDQAQEFTPEREQFLSTLNDSAAVALDNRYLLQSTENALQETAALYGATTNLSRARSQDEIAVAVQGAFESLTPDIYAAYLSVEEGFSELFNVSLDAAPVDFASLVAKHDLMDAENVFIDDLREISNPTPLENDLIALGNIRGVALVHLRSQNLPVGLFFLAYHNPRPFSAGDERYLNSVADSASVVVDNYLLLDQIQNSLEETSILYQASRALNDASTPDEILDVIVSHLISRPITQIFIALLSTENWENPKAMAQVVATWQREGEAAIDLVGINLVAEQYPAWRLLASPNVLTIDDVSESEELDMMERIGVESLELRSLSVLPLRIAGRSIGAIVIGGREAYHHSERDQRIYRSLAEQASLRMEAARLLTQTERRARQLTTSAEVSQIASSILDLNYLLPRIVDLIRDSFEYDHVQVFLMDDMDNFADLRASTGDAGRQLLEIRHKLQKGSTSVIGQVTATGQPTIASDTADARVVHRPNPYLPNTRSEMAIPLKLKSKVVGALDVQSNEPNAFDDDDIQVLTTLAAQISVAIDNAQLFEQARSRANEMSFLFDVTTAAASAETLQSAIQNVAKELRTSLMALSVSIYLPQKYVDSDEAEFLMLEPVALAGSDQPLSELSEVRLDSENNLIADAARSRRPIIIDNIYTKADYLPVVDGARSAIIVPLTSGAQVIGLIALESSELSAYGQDTLTLLLTLSGTLTAIIQNQQLLEQVQQTNEQLRELDRLKSDFLANMSHELRTPLNSIIGFSRVILKGIDGSLTEMQEQDLTTIYNSGLHLLNLINDILDQAKIAAGKMDLQFDYFEMKAVIDGVRSIGIGLVKDKPIDIFVDIAPGLPKVYGDEFRTRQILINLISNAAKFTREGSITISSYPVRDEETNTMMIRTDVTDTGIGIAEGDMPLLFEAFRQVDSSLTRTQGGTGLGLPISKSLVEMQGGRMLVSSRVNVGSTFSIMMPVDPVVVQEEKPKKKTDNLGDAKKGTTGPLSPIVTGPLKEMTVMNADPVPFVHTKRQILLIEDNPDMVDQYRRALQREGFDIFTASIPLEAEAMASGLHPTIIVMDVNFAGGQGWEILGRLKARDDTFDIPVIIVTLSNERERACDMGTFSFLQRPFAPDELVAAVQEAERDSRVERILIIDDQPESVRLFRQLLDEQGQYRVFSADNGVEGIALVARRRPDLVILDLRMPEMDGFQVVQELRNNPETATIPILVVTGDDSISSNEREQLMNLSVLHKGDISADEYHQFIEGVRSYLNGD